LEHRSEENKHNNLSNSQAVQDESFAVIASKAKREQLPEMGFGLSSIRRSGRLNNRTDICLPGRSGSGQRKPSIHGKLKKAAFGSSLELQVRAGEGDSDEIEDNEAVILGVIRETQHETEANREGGEVLGQLQMGVESKLLDLKNFFSPLQTRAMELKKHISLARFKGSPEPRPERDLTHTQITQKKISKKAEEDRVDQKNETVEEDDIYFSS